MNAQRYLIYGVAINGVKHPLRFKWYDDDVNALIATMRNWLPIIVLRVNSGGVKSGYEFSDVDWHGYGVHIAYWYDESMYYYVEHSDTMPDFCPSPAIAHDYESFDKAPSTLTQAQAFANLWDAVLEREKKAKEADDIQRQLQKLADSRKRVPIRR